MTVRACPPSCVIHPHKGRKVIKGIAVAVGMAAFLAVVGLVAFVALEDVESDRERFIQQCRNQGGTAIDLGPKTDPVCKFGRLTIEYGD